ncbi:YqjF family protein [Amycolatopsis sp. cg9]|uniref:YqjF family protein n=1 Tax=Amycolatopsis sp. cg9 TaxID=3238801 RepID=UPI0035256A0D
MASEEAGGSLVMRGPYDEGHRSVSGLPEPVTPVSPHRLRAVLFSQVWRDLTFLHWPVEPAVVAPLLPPGTRPDCRAGRTYVGLVPFRMTRVGVLGSPPVPYFGDFLETNVRLYSVDRDGHRGVVFRSLDTARLIPVLAARFGLGVPYRWSRMLLERDGDVIGYRSRHRRSAAAAEVVVRVGEPVRQNGLDRFLTDRWALHTRFAGRTWRIPNVHPRWTFRSVEVISMHEDLIASAGLPVPEVAPVSALYSAGVPVHFGVPEPVGA